MKVSFKLLAAIFLALSVHKTEAAVKQELLSNMDGLSNNSVITMFQDSEGMMWIGTWDGLNAYNGRTFKVFKFDSENPNSISNNIIWEIAEESPGIIWASTYYGINRIDVHKGSITRYYPGEQGGVPPAEHSYMVCSSSKGVMFFAVAGWGVAAFDPGKSSIVDLNIPGINSSSIKKISCWSDNELVLLTHDKVLYVARYELSNSGIPKISITTEIITEAPAEEIYRCEGHILIALENGDIAEYTGNPQLAKICSLPYHDVTRALALVGTSLIAASNSGLWEIPLSNGTAARIKEHSDKNVSSLLYGTQDILWIGCDGQGLVKTYETAISFNKVANNELFIGRSRAIRAFMKDDEGRTYVGTKGNGIVLLSSEGEKIRSYTTDNGLVDNSVYVIEEIMEGRWALLGNDGRGISAIRLEDGSIYNIPPLQEFGNVYAICEDKRYDCVWLGTNGYGLVMIKFAEKEGKLVAIEQKSWKNDSSNPLSLSNNTIFALQPASKGRLWVGTRGGGLNLFDPGSCTFRKFTSSKDKLSITNNDILSLHADDENTLWIGTSYGLSSLKEEDIDLGRFSSYTEVDGLANNTIHGILDDMNGHLWLSTTKGLSQFNKADAGITNFNNIEELQNNEFSDGAYYRSKDGIMFFGGVDGFNWFRPEGIHQRDFCPSLLFESFHIRQVEISDKDWQVNGVILNHDENFFSVSFVAMDFIRNSGCEYSYMLENFSDGWTLPSTDNNAVFTNVPPGKYRLLVRCTNGDKVGNNNISSLDICIKAPWWKRWWACILEFMFALSVVWTGFASYKERERNKREKLVEEVNKQKQIDKYETKLSFFTSIAHEFCTPLTLIYGSCEYMLDRFSLDGDLLKQMKIIRNNSSRMQKLINELMEFRKADTGRYIPKYSSIDIGAMLRVTIDNFSEAIKSASITIDVDIPEIGDTIVSDKEALDKIVYNILSNAVKYTPDFGTISLQCTIGKDGLTLSVKNSGKGIKPEDLDKVFNRFEILDNLEKQMKRGKVIRNGIGLALAKSLAITLDGDIEVCSVPEESTTFKLVLPTADVSAVKSVSEPEGSGNEVFMEEENDFKEPIIERTACGRDDIPFILTIDDESGIRTLLSEILTAEGYMVIGAENGKKALEIIRQRRPDLIISDIVMKEMDGMELLKYIRTNDLTKHIPFIFLSFKNDIEYKIQGSKFGGDAYIQKPFHPKHLTAIVRQILENRKLLKDYYNSFLSNRDIFDGNVMDTNDKKFLMNLTKEIEDNITDDELSLDFLCNKLSISRIQLYRKVTELTNMSPSEYISSIKVRHAHHMLATTSLTVQEIMYASGFNNKSYFYREFKKFHNTTPKKFREDLLNQN
ncbi:MAG: response regulator [Bacteroidales bacterium]|nr:response regulator [Bacteroidales bacterium]